MARGPYYTEKEDTVLKALYKDNLKKKYVEIAELAQRYGICVDRSRDALAQHISMLINPPETASDQEEVPDLEVMILEKNFVIADQKYNALLSTIIDTMTLFDDPPHAPKLDFKAIRDWVFRNEPERINARLEELAFEMEEKNAKAK